MSLKQADIELLNSYKDQTERTIGAISCERPLLLVFLRHFGCTFCRQAVAEISEIRKDIEAKGTGLAFVHLASDDSIAQKFFSTYSLSDLPRFADPEGKLFEAFGLVRGDWRSYINHESILRMFIAWLEGHWVGLPAGDVQRMPGAFLLHNCQIRKAFRHKLVSDRPDYLQLASPA